MPAVAGTATAHRARGNAAWSTRHHSGVRAATCSASLYFPSAREAQWLGAQWVGRLLECRAAQSRQARPPEEPSWGAAKSFGHI